MKCDILMLRGKNRLSLDVHLLLSEGYLREYCGCFYSKGQLASLADSSMARFASQSVMQISDHLILCSRKFASVQ
jgi:hypothetical protein